ncbi:MAG: hypothetical protein R6V12_15800 [Candidatus Hydrogenedentota bacterium]
MILENRVNEILNEARTEGQAVERKRVTRLVEVILGGPVKNVLVKLIESGTSPQQAEALAEAVNLKPAPEVPESEDEAS